MAVYVYVSTAVSVATMAANRFCSCGDYLQGVARIRCTNPECGNDYFRPFFRHDRRLFSGGSRLIYDILRELYHEAAGRTLLTGMVIAHQTFGDMLRFNPHFHVTELTQHIPPARKTWVMHRCRTKTKRLVLTHANAPGRGSLRRCTNSFHWCARSAVRT